ncbi:hypothetical protein CPLU01_09255 [Colletotrichum plurivorum]|uniref:MYND-type domain-containing protein n=1 Tax=Colletotrichum plurivorum TaxID=2175906 RepID=A0A8H6K9B6_9PEZI|nr:hypothetical protein CPLU01_09255 [Colletotrichum plurivorum]
MPRAPPPPPASAPPPQPPNPFVILVVQQDAKAIRWSGPWPPSDGGTPPSPGDMALAIVDAFDRAAILSDPDEDEMSPAVRPFAWDYETSLPLGLIRELNQALKSDHVDHPGFREHGKLTMIEKMYGGTTQLVDSAWEKVKIAMPVPLDSVAGCHRCLRPRNASSLVPWVLCTYCIQVRYDSDECRRKHWEEKHKEECIGVIDQLVASQRPR